MSETITGHRSIPFSVSRHEALGTLLVGVTSRMPSSTSRMSRSLSTFRAIPRSLWKSSKRRSRGRRCGRSASSSGRRSPRACARSSRPASRRCAGARCQPSVLRCVKQPTRVGCVSSSNSPVRRAGAWIVVGRCWESPAVAVFMSFLDVTIVNVAFPDIERDFAEVARRPVLGPERVQHRVRGPARARRPARGPVRTPADVPHRRGRLPRHVAAGGLGVGRAAGGGAHPAGGGGRDPRADLTGAPVAGVPGPQARHRRGDLERHGRRRGRARPSLGGLLVDAAAGAGCSS